MLRHRHSAPGLCLALLLTGSLTPKLAHAEDRNRDEDRPIRLYANATLGLIGKVMGNSLGGGAIRINGRLAHEDQTIWNGDLIEAPANLSAYVLLDSVGQVTLRSGAQVRLATTLTKLDDTITRPVLVASLISGDMVVKLQQEAIAYIEACGSAYISSGGASFRISVRNGHPMVDAATGTVSLEAESGQINCAIRPVTIDANRRVTGSAADSTRVERRTAQNINLQYICNGQPVRGQPILVTLKKNIGRIGSQTITKPTDDIEGVVTITFTAGPSPNSSDITANAVGSAVPQWTGHITIPGFWTPRNKLLVAAAAAGVTSCIIGCKGNGPIKQLPPPTIQ